MITFSFLWASRRTEQQTSPPLLPREEAPSQPMRITAKKLYLISLSLIVIGTALTLSGAFLGHSNDASKWLIRSGASLAIPGAILNGLVTGGCTCGNAEQVSAPAQTTQDIPSGNSVNYV